MKSYSAFYVRTDKPDEAKKIFGRMERVPESPWLVCAFQRDASPPADKVLWGEISLTVTESQRLGEVIFLFADISRDSFVYEHALDGVLLRKLVWFPMLDDAWTPGWLFAEGQREEWESIFFRPDRLPELIANERCNYQDRGESSAFPDREAELRRIWTDCVIVAGTTIPECDGSMARVVERHFGIIQPPSI
jgi:hypothetical protein